MHPTIGILELLLTLLLAGAVGVQGMNYWEGHIDRRAARKAGASADTQEAVDMAVRMDAVLLSVDFVLLVLGIRGMYRTEQMNSWGTQLIYGMFSILVASLIVVSIKNRRARWRILRPTIAPDRKEDSHE
jgi:hypothetical protein